MNNTHTNTSNRNTATPTSGSNPTLYPPHLTDNEHRLLHDHEGCLKCRDFYVTHRAKECTKTLSGKDYKECTFNDTLRTKKTKTTTMCPMPIAVVLEVELETMPTGSDLVAAVFPPATSFSTDKSLSDGSDSSLESVSALPPLKGKHFIWTC
jgi:hypothetical protein